MEEQQDNNEDLPLVEESNQGTIDIPGSPPCPFCGSSNVLRDEDSGDWRCGKCGRYFGLQPVVAEEKRAPKTPKAPWETPDTAAPRGRQINRSAVELAPRRIDEDAEKLLLPLNLQLALSWTLTLAMILGGVFTVVLGGHGLYVFFSAVEGMLPVGKDGADLFLATGVPGQLKGIVEWCTFKGLSSWTIPASLVGAGPLLWILQSYVPGTRFRW